MLNAQPTTGLIAHRMTTLIAGRWVAKGDPEGRRQSQGSIAKGANQRASRYSVVIAAYTPVTTCAIRW